MKLINSQQFYSKEVFYPDFTDTAHACNDSTGNYIKDGANVSVKGEAAAWAFTHHRRSHTQTTPGFHCWVQGPFPISRWVNPSHFSLTHTHAFGHFPSFFRLNPRFPAAESQASDFVKINNLIARYSSRVSQLGASREGPWTKKSLGNYTLAISTPAPHTLFTCLLVQWWFCSGVF